MGKVIKRTPGLRLLISSLPGSALRTHVESLRQPRDVNKPSQSLAWITCWLLTARVIGIILHMTLSWKVFKGRTSVKIKVKLLLLTLNAPIATKVVCFSRLLKCLRILYGKQCGPRPDCSYKSSLFWVHAVCFYA